MIILIQNASGESDKRSSCNHCIITNVIHLSFHISIEGAICNYMFVLLFLKGSYEDADQMILQEKQRSFSYRGKCKNNFQKSSTLLAMTVVQLVAIFCVNDEVIIKKRLWYTDIP